MFLLLGSCAAAEAATDNVLSANIREAVVGSTDQNTNQGSGIKTDHIVDGAVTAPKLAIPCPDGLYLKYSAASGWGCSDGTPGPVGPQGPIGPEGPMPHYANVAVVASSGGDYSSPVQALAETSIWCSAPSAANRCLIKIMPGTYDLGAGTVFMQEYTDIEGSGVGSTTLLGEVHFQLIDQAELRLLTVKSTVDQGFGMVRGLMVFGGSPRISDVAVVAQGETVWGISTEGVSDSSAAPVLRRVTIDAAGSTVFGIVAMGQSLHLDRVSIQTVGTALSEGIDNAWGHVDMQDSNIEATGCAGAIGLRNHVASATIKNSSITGSGIGVTAGYQPVGGSGAAIHHSIIRGNVSVAAADADSWIRVGASQLVGARSGTTVVCAGAYDGNFTPLSCP